MENSLLMYYSTKRQKTIVVHLDGTVGERSGKPVQLLKDWCWSAGSSFEGRIACYKRKTGRVQKPAILIRSSPALIFFPTAAMSRHDCIYLRHDQIRRIQGDRSGCVVEFHSGVTYRLDYDVRIIRKQRRHCLQYLQLLSGGGGQS